MSLAIILGLNRWWIRQLVNALLRPMFCRYRAAERAGDAVLAARCEIRFLRVLNAANCWPFCIEVTPHGLFVLDEPSEPDRWEDVA